MPGSEWTAEEGEEREGPGNLQLVVVLNEMAREAPKNSFLNKRNAPNFHYYVATIVCENQKGGSPLIENGTNIIQRCVCS